MDDSISRQSALDIINSELNGWLTDDERLHLEGVGTAIECLPSAQPERKKGKWIPIPNTRLVTCECGFITDRLCMYNFCPDCGAEMTEGETDE